LKPDCIHCRWTNGAPLWALNGKQSCVVGFAGDTLTVNDSGGVGDHIVRIVFATDAAGNQTATCEVEVVKPSK
jgi:hypothetical protein